MSFNSFRPPDYTSNNPYRSPSPPHRFLEPLSPARQVATLLQNYTFEKSRLDDATAAAGIQWQHTPRKSRVQQKAEKRLHHQTSQTPHSGLLRSSHHHRSPSTIDTLATVALSTSPTFSPTSPSGAQFGHFPRNINGWHTDGGRPYPVNGRAFDGNDRPAKRARSELLPSPRGPLDQLRPSTSHVPVMWSSNVEQNIDNGSASILRNGSHNRRESTATQSGANLYEAELLLGLKKERRHSSHDKGQQRPHFDVQPLLNSSIEPDVGEQLYRAAYGNSASSKDFESLVLKSSSGVHQPSTNAAEDLPNWRRDSTVLANPDDLRNTANDRKLSQTQTPPDDEFVGPVATEASTIEHPNQETSKNGNHKKGIEEEIPNVELNRSQAGDEQTNEVDQLASPESLPDNAISEPSRGESSFENQITTFSHAYPRLQRRHSFGQTSSSMEQILSITPRAVSVPLEFTNIDVSITFLESVKVPDDSTLAPAETMPKKAVQVTSCKSCGLSQNPERRSEEEIWISCNGCDAWFHWACAGLKSEREVRIIDKFFCRECKPKHGATTYVRQSGRAKTTVDYAGLNEGILRNSDENPEHHYIKFFKEGGITLQPEKFPRMRPELVTAEYFERCGGMKDPVVIPARWNPRPDVPSMEPMETSLRDSDLNHATADFTEDEWLTREFEYESVPNDGQDKLDMVIPRGLTVRRVAELLGNEEKIEVIDVKSQEGGQKGWNMRRWADYYEAAGEKTVRNVISLEVSDTKLGRLIRRPKIVRDLDLQDSVWPADEQSRGNFPKVQFYCLMSVADCFTDFHIDFGGSSVYYHILKGKKTFFFIPPEPRHLKKYEEWCMSAAQNFSWLGDQTKVCYRVDLSEGDTMLIPSGWIHAVWTPENSLVIGGNFLTRLHYENQLKVFEVEKATKVARKFRYPFFQKVMWFTAIRYLERDPLPTSVEQLFYDGKRFERTIPIYLEEPNDEPAGTEQHNARYYSEAELTGLPHLSNYIWRTVLISTGKIEGVTSDTRNAVSRSIPKNHGLGEPLEVAKLFAMWVAWKRGNEDIPQWAHPEAGLPDSDEPRSDKKLSTAALRRLERQAAIEAYRVAPDRVSARQAMKAAEVASSEAKSSNHDHQSTPKTSVLGPKRIACDACRKRRIRCKHKEVEAPATSSTTKSPQNASKLYGVVIDQTPSKPSMVNEDSSPTKLTLAPKATRDSLPDDNSVVMDSGKKPRTKACVDCRKSKRRCIHDENGMIDPVKAAEAPVPRGSTVNKKRKPTGEMMSPYAQKKLKEDQAPSEQGIAGIATVDTIAIDPALMAISQGLPASYPGGPHAPVAPMAVMAEPDSATSFRTDNTAPMTNVSDVYSEVERQTESPLLVAIDDRYPLEQRQDDLNWSGGAGEIAAYPGLSNGTLTATSTQQEYPEMAVDPGLQRNLPETQLRAIAEAASKPMLDVMIDPQLQDMISTHIQAGSDRHTAQDRDIEHATSEMDTIEHPLFASLADARQVLPYKDTEQGHTASDSSANNMQSSAEPANASSSSQINSQHIKFTEFGKANQVRSDSLITADDKLDLENADQPAAAKSAEANKSEPAVSETVEERDDSGKTVALQSMPRRESMPSDPGPIAVESKPLGLELQAVIATGVDDIGAKTLTPRSEEDLTSDSSTSRKRAISSPLTDLVVDENETTAVRRSHGDQKPLQQEAPADTNGSTTSSFKTSNRRASMSSRSSTSSAAQKPVAVEAPSRRSGSQSLKRKSSTPGSAPAKKVLKQYGRQKGTPVTMSPKSQQNGKQSTKGTPDGKDGNANGNGNVKEESQEERDARMARELNDEMMGLRRRSART
ncbi:MAG: JmjC domain-containing histone demethylation protein 1 [Bogoriella megaspora]|nr:MAG: JmjC domain-containing histone demethylation protein 1 [Bogoriella megaspora]